MYVYANINPMRKLTDDCLVRAVAVIMGISWEKAYMDLCQRGLLIFDMPNTDATLSIYMREKGFKREVIENTCPACYTIRQFCEDNPYGEYILLTSGHAVAVINGDYYDTSDSGDMIPQYYWTKGE